MKTSAVLLSAALLATSVAAQKTQPSPDTLQKRMQPEMKHSDMPPKKLATFSTSLVVKGLDGKPVNFSVDDIKNMTHVEVTVHNMHTKADEHYSGVPVSEFIKRAEPALATGEKLPVKPLMMVVVFGATDNYHVVFTECDIDPSCRNGMVIVADAMEGKPLTTDGAFKLVSTEDKKPQRWVRNLNLIVLKGVE